MAAHRLDGGDQIGGVKPQECVLQLVRVIAIIMPLS